MVWGALKLPQRIRAEPGRKWFLVNLRLKIAPVAPMVLRRFTGNASTQSSKKSNTRTSQAVLLSLVVSLVLSRLDYCNATLAGLPGNQLDRPQSVMNAAARLVCSARKYEHITPLLRHLHWLPERIEFKLCFRLSMSAWYGSAVPSERTTSCGGRGYKKEAAIFVDVCHCHTIFV